MKKVREIELVFENVTTCTLKPDMFKYLTVQGIKKNIKVNCYQYEDGEIQDDVIICEYFHIEINQKGLDQIVPIDECTLRKKLLMKDIVAVIIKGEKEQEIFVPWNDLDDFSNKFQNIKIHENGNIEVAIQETKGSD